MLNMQTSTIIILNNYLKELVLNLATLSDFDFSQYIGLNMVADTVISMIANNVSIPKWSVENKYEILYAKDFYFRFFYGDKDIAKLVAGPILHEIKNNLVKKAQDNPGRKISLYMTVYYTFSRTPVWSHF